MADNEDLKAKMREALDRKRAAEHPEDADGRPQEKTHGPEVARGKGPRMHRRKAGGGGS
jgi:hypothetical protein